MKIDETAESITTAIPVSTSTVAGTSRMYSETNFISVGSIFLPRYSGVRPTISPAMKTARIASTRMPYRPEPTPPGETSDSMMFTSTTPPPNGVIESCELFTAPVDVPVVEAAKAALPGIPNRTSLPSMLPPDDLRDRPSLRTCGFGCASKAHASSTEPIHRTAITAASA